MKFIFECSKVVGTNPKKNKINEAFVAVRFVIYWKDMVEHAKTVGKINNIGFGKSG